MLKRAFDATLSGIGLLIAAPVWIAIAVAIKAQDGGPVLLRQPRVGRHGDVFPAFKFRSMVPGAERQPPRQASEHDPRVTPVGRVLRATALDELPQLFNILRGDMSFVGPRPLLAQEIELRGTDAAVELASIRRYAVRHSVRPGLTGLTQLYASRDVTRARKFRLDEIYVRNASFCLDVYLVVLSFWVTARGKWEVRGSKL